MRFNPESLTHSRLCSNEVEATARTSPLPCGTHTKLAEAATAGMILGSVPEVPLSYVSHHQAFRLRW